MKNILSIVNVEKIKYRSSKKIYMIILKEINKKNKIEIRVGSFEAQSIALALEDPRSNLPLTQDLICDIIKGLKGNLKFIKIILDENGLFFAKLEIEGESFGTKIIDSRVSDALTVAIRMKIPIFIDSILLNKSNESNSYLNKKDIPYNRLDILYKKLNNAIEIENYEEAAMLRDEINDSKTGLFD